MTPLLSFQNKKGLTNMADIKSKTKQTAKKSNSVETTVTARLANAIKTLKGVLVSISPTHLVFQYQRPHSASWNEQSIPLATVISFTGNKGKVGDVTYIDSGDITIRKGVATVLPNGFIEVVDTDRHEAPRKTTFNPVFASVVATGLEAPAASTGYVAKAKSVKKEAAAAPKKIKKAA